MSWVTYLFPGVNKATPMSRFALSTDEEIFGLRECTVKLFEATRNDHHECPDTQSGPHWYSELVYCRTVENRQLLLPAYYLN